MTRRVLIVGLSALGEQLVRTLAGSVDLYAVDRKPGRVASLARLSGVEVACFDAADPLALSHFLPREHVDVGLVAVGGDFLGAEQVAEALRTLTLEGRGTSRPQIGRIIVTANRPYRAEILQSLGHDVVKPVITAAMSLAVVVAHEGLESFIWLAPAGPRGTPFGVSEIPVPADVEDLRVDEVCTRFPGIRFIGMRDAPGGPIVSLTRRVAIGSRLVAVGEAHVLAEASRHLRDRTEAAGSAPAG